jgi:hypothetical protein
VARAGIKKLLLFNSHGGQVSVMDIVARELRSRCGLLVYSASWFSLPLPNEVSARFSADEHRFGIHAGAIETSMMLHLRRNGCAWSRRRIFTPARRTAPRATRCWAMGAVQNWAGKCRTTTPRVPWAMPLRRRQRTAVPWCRQPVRNWRSC